MFDVAQKFAAKGIVTVGMIRPGYFTTSGAKSTGSTHGRKDGYRKNIIETIAGVIRSLKDHYKADYVIMAGRSGGSAISGIIIGKYPGLVNAAVLGSCPCDVRKWRSYRRDNAYPNSLSPSSYTDNMAKDARVIAITGSNDKNTPVFLAKGYVDDLQDNGINAVFVKVPEKGHDAMENTLEYHLALDFLLTGRSYGELQSSVDCPSCGSLRLTKPESAVGLDVNATAKHMVEDLGKWATLDVEMRAAEVLAAGDKESYAIWMKVLARVKKLL